MEKFSRTSSRQHYRICHRPRRPILLSLLVRDSIVISQNQYIRDFLSLISYSPSPSQAPDICLPFHLIAVFLANSISRFARKAQLYGLATAAVPYSPNEPTHPFDGDVLPLQDVFAMCHTAVVIPDFKSNKDE